MVRKGITNARIKKGIIPTKSPFKDRERMVHYIITTFDTRFTKNQRDSMAKLAKEIIEIGDADAFFGGKDPGTSGIAIFVYVCRRFSYDGKCVVTYPDIRENIMHFSSGASFVDMLKALKKKFG